VVVVSRCVRFLRFGKIWGFFFFSFNGVLSLLFPVFSAYLLKSTGLGSR
jgi:hypothetical protein